MQISYRFVDVGEVSLIGPDLVHEAMEKVWLIRERLRKAESQYKSYANVRSRDIDFGVHNWSYFIISSMKGVMGLTRKGSLVSAS